MTQTIVTPASGMSPCPCGSGKRYEECHGRSSAQGDASVAESTRLIVRFSKAALAAQQRGDLLEALRLYDEALRLSPDQPDCLHMKAAIKTQQGEFFEADRLFRRAGDLTNWNRSVFASNYAWMLSKAIMVKLEKDESRLAERLSCLAQQRAVKASARQTNATPRVSIIVPSYNHERYIEEALTSVFEQTWPHMEIVIIDDGSKDDSAALIARLLERSPFPYRFIARENRGAHATINEAMGLVTGDYVNVLNSDDAFTPDRIENFVSQVHRTGADWGFARCLIMDDQGAPLYDSRVKVLTQLMDNAQTTRQATKDFLAGNPSISTGNIFMSRELFNSVGGFSDLRYNHDWEFCLKACWLSEPVVVRESLYRYRFHSSNTISESAERGRIEAGRIIRGYMDQARQSRPSNPLAINFSDDRVLFEAYVLRHANLFGVSIGRLKEVAAAIIRSGELQTINSSAFDQFPPDL